MSRRMQLPSESWQLQAPGAPLPTRRTTRATAAALPAASDLSACLRALGGDFTEVGSALGAHHDAEMSGCGADLEAALALSLETDAPNAATASAHASAVVPEALGTADKLPRRSKKAKFAGAVADGETSADDTDGELEAGYDSDASFRRALATMKQPSGDCDALGPDSFDAFLADSFGDAAAAPFFDAQPLAEEAKPPARKQQSQRAHQRLHAASAARRASVSPSPRASRSRVVAAPRLTGAHMRFDAAGEEHAALVAIVAATPRRPPDSRSPNGICWAVINRACMKGLAGPLLQRRVKSVKSKVLSKRWFQFGPPQDYPNRHRILR